MKKLIKVTLVLLTMLGCLTGCGKKEFEIIGLWECIMSPEAEFIEFLDGQINMSSATGENWFTVFSSQEKEGEITWWYREDTKDNSDQFIYTIEDDVLTLKCIKYNGEEIDYGSYERVARKNNFPELSKEDIYFLIKKAHYEGQPWVEFYGAAYVSWSDEYEENGTIYYRVDSEIKTKEMLKEYLSEMYTDEVIDEVLNSPNLIEKEDGLYTAVYGLGGIGDGLCEVNAYQTETGYYLELLYCGRKSNGKFNKDNITHTVVKHLVYDDGKYKFAENTETGMNSIIGTMIVNYSYKDIDTAE